MRKELNSILLGWVLHVWLIRMKKDKDEENKRKRGKTYL